MGDALPYVPLGSNLDIESLACTYYHFCVVARDAQSVGRVKCFGYAYAPTTLGTGDAQDRRDAAVLGDKLPFVALGVNASIKAVAPHATGACVLDENLGRVKCWGQGPVTGQERVATFGALLSEMGDALPYVNLGTGVVARTIKAGHVHVCVVADGPGVTNGVKCWVSSSSRSQRG